ncbi:MULTISPECIES: helix-turn-helix domain-containing protein [Promicromonospora]|uniref:Helix-turn-helix domain-containing protein n=2 Tax=Promicromonospora TaxID=43676 RepID=A0ABW4V1B7_9MICO
MVNRANAARRFRAELLAKGHSVREVANEIGQRLNERPRLAWRRAMGWSQSELVEQYKARNPGSRLSVSRVSEYEQWPYNGTRPPSLKYLIDLAHTFGCTVADLVDNADLAKFTPAEREHLAAAQGIPTIQAGADTTARPGKSAGRAISVLTVPWTTAGGLSLLSSAPGGEQVDGREFLTLSAGAAVGVAHDWLTIEAPQVASAAGGGRIDGGLAASLEQRLPALRRIDHTLGGLRARPLVDAELRLVNDILTNSTYSNAVGRRLFAVAAELCRIAGWASCDAGQHGTAERYWTAGIRAAHLAGDRGIGANILKSLSLQRAEAGQHAQAIALAEAAREGVRGTDERVLAMLTARQARTHASRGDISEAERLLARADTHMGRVHEDGTPSWAAYFDDAEFHAQTASCYLLLGKYRTSDAMLERALALQPDERSRDRATYTIWRAEGALHMGDVEGACAHVSSAIPDLKGAVSPRNRKRLANLHGHLRPHAQLGVVRDLDAQLADLLQAAA